MSVLAGRAITGEKFSLAHPKLDLSQPYSSHVDVEFRGLTHQVQSYAGPQALSYATVTSEFRLGEYSGHIVETIDSLQTQHSRKFQAIISGPDSVLATMTYTNPTAAIELVASLDPQSLDGVMTVSSGDEAEVVGDARVALSTDIGIIEISPLTDRVLASLPEYKGTPTKTGAELFGGRHSDESPYLSLITKTARVQIMPSTDIDRCVEIADRLDASWG